MKKIIDEGERILESDQSQSTSEHLHRYKIASVFCTDKIVLDIACGEGYGSMLLSKTAKFVYGYDIDTETIERARKKYKKDNIEFGIASTIKIPLENNSIDVIISFETIEHILDHDGMIAEFKRILKSTGKLIISTPNKYIYTDIIGNKNRFHLKELYISEFKDLLKRYFKNIEVYYQRFFSASYIYNEINENIPSTITWLRGGFDNVELTKSPDPEYVIIIASDEKEVKETRIIENSFFIEENFRNKIINSYQNSSLRYKVGLIVLSPIRWIKNLMQL